MNLFSNSTQCENTDPTLSAGGLTRREIIKRRSYDSRRRGDVRQRGSKKRAKFFVYGAGTAAARLELASHAQKLDGPHMKTYRPVREATNARFVKTLFVITLVAVFGVAAKAQTMITALPFVISKSGTYKLAS